MQYMIKTKSGDIVHFGTKRHSGRYPYGSGKEPYQHEGLRGRILEWRKKRKNNKNLEKAREAKRTKEEASRKEAEEAVKREEETRRVFKEGTASEVYEKRHEYSNKELSEAIERIQLENKLKNLTKQETEKAFNDINNFMKKAAMVNGWATIGVKSIENIKAYQKVFSQLETKSNKTENKETK